MSGVGVVIDLRGLGPAEDLLERLKRLDRRDLLEVVGAVVESQSRRRLEEDKASPEGDPWPAWSPGYAKTRHGGHALLEGEGHLLDSLQYQVLGEQEVEIGSNLIYAATHQLGDERRGIPQRAVLGLSADDEGELDAVVTDYLREVLS